MSGSSSRRGHGAEGKGDAVVGAEVGLELGGDVDARRLAGRVLHHEKQLGDDLDYVSGLQDEVALALQALGLQAAGDVSLTAAFPSRRARLQSEVSINTTTAINVDSVVAHRLDMKDGNVVKVGTEGEFEDL